MTRTVHVIAVDQPELSPWRMPEKFRHEITYFMSPGGDAGVPVLAAGEYWIGLENARTWFDEGVFSLVSPLDSENKTEIELSEEQEDWLAWMLEHKVERVRLIASPDEVVARDD